MKRNYLACWLSVSLLISFATLPLKAQEDEQTLTQATDEQATAIAFSEAQTEKEVEASVTSVEQKVSEGEGVTADAVEEAVSKMDEQSVEEAIDKALPMIEPDTLPETAGEFLPDNDLLMDSPSYVPSYDEIVEQSRKVVRQMAEPGLELRENVAIRKARTKALTNPDVQAALENARAQIYHTEKTEAWKQYYDLLYKKMERADPKLSKKLKTMKEEDYLRLGIRVTSENGAE